MSTADQKAGESSGSHQFLGKDLKLNEVKNEPREMEKKRGPTQLSPGPVNINQSRDEDQSAKEPGKDPTGLEKNQEDTVRQIPILLGTQAKNILFSNNFFLRFPGSVQINSTPLRAFSFALDTQPFQALSM